MQSVIAFLLFSVITSFITGCEGGGGSSSLQSTLPAAQKKLSLGIAFGSKYQGENYAGHLKELGITMTHISVRWDIIEPSPGEYKFETIDSFVKQLDVNTIALMRIATNMNMWATKEGSVPHSFVIGGSYYNYVYNVVKRANGRIKYFENNWEADYIEHWGGTPAEYVELTRTFYNAVKAAYPQAIVIMGGAVGVTNDTAYAFWDEVFDLLSSDQYDSSFDMYDVHLYNKLYDIPQRIQSFRKKLDEYAEFSGKPIIVTEYGGPVHEEFKEKYQQEVEDLLIEIESDPCLLSSDLKSTPLHPEGYPDELRMFMYGLEKEPELDAKRDRIQGREMVQRTMLAFSAEVEQLYWWNIIAMETSALSPCYYRHPVFGKLALMKKTDNVLTPNPTYYFYQRMVEHVGHNLKSVKRINTVNDIIYLFEVTRDNDSRVFVIWEKRDQFYGEDQPTVPYTIDIPWSDVIITNLLENKPQIKSAVGGLLTLDINDTPVFIEEAL